MITLITGTPGSGKTLYAVSKIMEYVEQNKKLLNDGKEPRTIYSDIEGLTIDGVEPAPDDWRTTPDGSIIFYDEIQQRNEFKKSRFDNEICDALQVHRHTGHDIYGITQFPVLLHPNFRAVVGMHLHLHRGWGLTAATVFQWAYCVDAPNAPSNKKLAEHTFRFNYPKDLYKYYKSATQHTHKARIPKRILLGLAFILLMAYISYNLLFTKDNFLTNIYKGKKTSTAQVAPIQSNDKNTFGVSSQPIDNQQNQLSASQVQPMPTQEQIQQEVNELEKKYLSAEVIEFHKSENIRPASVISMGNQCTAYNKYGEKLNIPSADCKRMLMTNTLPKPRYDIQSQFQPQMQQAPMPAPQPQFVIEQPNE